MSDIQNGYFWFIAREEDADWWHLGGATREEAISKGRADYPGESFWIEEANRMEPSFALFGTDEIVERLRPMNSLPRRRSRWTRSRIAGAVRPAPSATGSAPAKSKSFGSAP
jgi:hypothetical protein